VSVHEIWISTDLKVPVLITDSDPRSGTRTSQLTNVVRSEPAATLVRCAVELYGDIAYSTRGSSAIVDKRALSDGRASNPMSDRQGAGNREPS